MSDIYGTNIVEILQNINNGIVPIDIPFEHQSFLTPENINAIINAINHNKGYRTVKAYDITPLEYFEGVQMFDSITYYPFGVEPEVEKSSIQLPYDYEFTLENTSLYYYGSVTMSKKIKDIQDVNERHKYFHSLGFEPFARKNMDGSFTYDGGFYTKKDYYPSSTSSEWAKEHYPINAKAIEIDGYPNDTNLRKAFGFAPRDDSLIGGTIFANKSSQNLDNVLHSSIMMFRAFNNDGLIIETGADGVVLPYHNKVLYYCNPHYGFYDNYYDVKDFKGGGSDPITYREYITGTAYACGFDVVWFTDSEFWITLKYKLVYQDRRPEKKYDDSLCCIAQCFGITK